MHALVAGGADLLELGVPFSDPMADGSVIQRSSERALVRGVTTADVFDFVRGFRRKDLTTLVILMGYLNPIEVRGANRYAEATQAAGVDGLLPVDLPPEEAALLHATFSQYAIELISLVAPTTSLGRLARLAETAQGCLYYVSFAGVTGASVSDTGDVAERVCALRKMARVPVLIGFGNQTPASAAAMARLADGIIVGSALVECLALSTSVDDATLRADAFLTPLRTALDCLSSSD